VVGPAKVEPRGFRMNRIASNELTPKAKILRHLSDLGTPEQAAHFLKRQLDVVWRAAGKHGSFYFDENATGEEDIDHRKSKNGEH